MIILEFQRKKGGGGQYYPSKKTEISLGNVAQNQSIQKGQGHWCPSFDLDFWPSIKHKFPRDFFLHTAIIKPLYKILPVYLE